MKVKEPRDRTAEMMSTSGEIEICRNDFCEAYKMDEDRLFLSRECWYCKYGSFGIYSENPTKIGICKYPEHEKSL